jgi:predicted dehydrogenase
MKINVGLIGYGYWGPNLLRNFMNTNNCEVVSVCDFSKDRLDTIPKSYNLQLTSDPNEILKNNEIDCVLIATPVFTHYELAYKALNNGKHVLIEKPMTSTSKEALSLIELSTQKNLTLMVDHTFLYTGAVNKIKKLVSGNQLGKLNYFDSTRINLGLFQPDINVLWDLAPHDISILLYLIDDFPISVNATGICHTNNNIENIAYLTLNFKDDFIAHFNCSWSSPVKVRNTLISGDKKMVLFNDLEPSEKIRVYNTSYDHKSFEDKKRILVDYRTGDVEIPKLNNSEALSEVAKDFINSIKNNCEPKSNSKLGLNVVKILEAAQSSLNNNGNKIKIN